MAKKGVGGGFIPHLGVVVYPRPRLLRVPIVGRNRPRVDVVEMSKKCMQKGRNGWDRVKIQKCHIPNMEEASKPTLGATMMPLVSQSLGLYYGQTPK